MKKIYNFLKSINLYGINFPLLYQKKSNYTTLLDMFLTFITLIIIIILSLKYFIEYFKSLKFSIVTNYYPVISKIPLDLSINSIKFALYSYNGTLITFDESYISFSIYKNNFGFINHTWIRDSINIEFEQCNKNENIEKIKDNDYEKFICVKQNQNLTIAGRYGDIIQGFEILEFHLNKCKNSSNSKIICKSNEEIENYILNSYIDVLYMSYYVNHFQSYPIYQSLRTDALAITLNTVKRYIYYFSDSIYIDNHGIFFENSKNYSFYEFHSFNPDHTDEEKKTYYEGDNIILEIIFTVYDKQTEYIRNYPLLQDVLSNIGGFTQTLLTIFQFLSNYFSKKFFVKEIYQKLISEKIKKNCNVNDNEKIIEKENDNPNTYIRFIDIGSKNELNSNKNKFKQLNYLNKSNTKINHNKKKNLNYPYKKKTIKKLNSSKNEKKMFKFYYYILPFWILEKYTNNWVIDFYENIFKKFLSIEIIIPFLERLNMMIDLKNDNYIFCFDLFFQKYIREKKFNKNE